jgi:hypothetical protein
MSDRAAAAREAAGRVAWLLVGVSAIVAFDLLGAEFYGGFRVLQGTGMYSLQADELTHMAYFTALGGVAVGALVQASRGLASTERLATALVRVARGGPRLAWASAALLFGACLLISLTILRGAVVSDDEHTYRFIARTLATGHLTAPSPGSDLPFFREQFVVLTADARYGKYPIGHPLLLALGQLAGNDAWVVPLVTALLLPAAWWVASQSFNSTIAGVSVLLMLVSPTVLLTGSTLVSQPLSALCCVLGAGCLLRAPAAGDRWWWAAGGAFAYGVLVRPLPGVLFVAVALAYAAWTRRDRPGGALRALAGLAVPVAVVGGLLLLVNQAQSGSALTSGYQSFHGTGSGAGILTNMSGDAATRASSVVGSVLRLNAWLFGWPLSLLLCVFAPRTRASVLLWCFCGADLAYRLAAPKVGVGTTGPIYLFETVPLLSILGASGAAALLASPRRVPVGGLAAAGLAASLVSVTLFLPPKLRDLARAGAAQRLPFDLLAARRVDRAVVFHASIVPWTTRLSWAYFPPCNGPLLDDAVVFARLQPGAQSNLDFWRRRYPDRSAWFFGYSERGPFLVDLPTHLAAQAPSAAPAGP